MDDLDGKPTIFGNIHIKACSVTNDVNSRELIVWTGELQLSQGNLQYTKAEKGCSIYMDQMHGNMRGLVTPYFLMKGSNSMQHTYQKYIEI